MDARVYGRLVRSARIERGFDRVQDFCDYIYETTGLHIAPQTLYRIETGRQIARMDIHVAIVAATEDPSHFVRAFSPRVLERLPGFPEGM